MLNTTQAHRSGIKIKKGGQYENQHESAWTRYFPLAQKMQNSRHFMPKRQRIKNIFDWSYPDSYRDKLAAIE
jgi:type II secretory pathway component PulL